jgi:hypothetical protein
MPNMPQPADSGFDEAHTLLITLISSSPNLFTEHFELSLDTTSESTSSSGGDEADLSTSRSVPGDTTGLTDVLMVTTSVRMLDRVHGHTSDNRPHLSLRFLSVVLPAGLEHGLLVSSAACHDADHGSGIASHGLLDA